MKFHKFHYLVLRDCAQIEILNIFMPQSVQ
jgi:hypothetical protein